MADDFSSTGADTADATPLAAGQLKKNGYALLKGFPCKIADISVSKTGKHGHAKCNFVGYDIFTGKKYEDLCPSTHNMSVPVVVRTEWELIDISDDGFASLHPTTGDVGDPKETLKIQEGELGEKIRAAFDAGEVCILNVTSAMKQEQILGFKTGTQED
jgi:translation initiation factor 5A